MTTTHDSRRETIANLDRFEELARLEHHLGVLITLNENGSPQVSVVNCGIVIDPDSGERGIGLVARQGQKLRNLRRRPTATVVVRAGWEWIAASGPVSIGSPDDLATRARYSRLARDIFHAAGGTHPDLARYDAVMIEERRCTVLIRPERFSANPPGAEHRESEHTPAATEVRS
jgi:PPOX class probable F420-dependent enzyme